MTANGSCSFAARETFYLLKRAGTLRWGGGGGGGGGGGAGGGGRGQSRHHHTPRTPPPQEETTPELDGGPTEQLLTLRHILSSSKEAIQK